MQLFLHILPAILCLSLLVPAASADEWTETTAPTYETAAYTEAEPTELTEPTQAATEPTDSPETPETEPTEEIPLVPEETNDTDMDSLFGQLVESQQNTEYAVQMLSGFCLFFVICILCYFGYKFFRIFF